MTQYAAKTDVPSDRSRSEIERILQRYGATAFMYGWNAGRALVQFEARHRRIKFEIRMPDPNDKRFTHHSRGRRTPEAAQKEYEQAARQRWRALALVIKAKLEAVESGISEFEEEFMANIVLPNGQTVGQYALPHIEQIYQTGNMQPLLPKLN